MPVYVVLLIAVVVAVRRARSRIDQVEGPEGWTERTASRSERWKQAPGVEKAAFVVMAVTAAVWLLLILPIGFAFAAVAVAAAVWKRPYLEGTLAPVIVIGGVVIVAYDLLVPLVRDPGDWGAAVINAAMFGGLWILVGMLLGASARSGRTSSTSPVGKPRQ